MKIGDKVRFLSEVGGGIVTGFEHKRIETLFKRHLLADIAAYGGAPGLDLVDGIFRIGHYIVQIAPFHGDQGGQHLRDGSGIMLFIASAVVEHRPRLLLENKGSLLGVGDLDPGRPVAVGRSRFYMI